MRDFTKLRKHLVELGHVQFYDAAWFRRQILQNIVIFGDEDAAVFVIDALNEHYDHLEALLGDEIIDTEAYELARQSALAELDKLEALQPTAH